MLVVRCVVVAATVVLASACKREDRDFRETPPGAAPSSPVVTSGIHAGGRAGDPAVTVYEENAWAIGEGKRLYSWFNCAGCHAPGGGGAMGPPLIDDQWIYGSDPENIYQTIQQGRPNGMPSFRGRIGSADTWKLVAYIRSLSELTPPTTWSARGDQMEAANPDPERRPLPKPPAVVAPQ